jgi:uncharacterized membrane protein
MNTKVIGKSIFKSKTVWVNVIGLVIMLTSQGVLTKLGISVQLQATVLSVANVILRYITTEPVYVLEDDSKDDSEEVTP